MNYPPSLSADDLLKGALAGASATVPMTISMYVLRQILLPENTLPLGPNRVTHWFESQTALEQHLNRGQHVALMLASHIGYGALAGMVYAPYAARHSAAPIQRGMAFGLLVWAASYAGWLPLLQIMPLPPHRSSARRIIMITAHLVWGAALARLLESTLEKQGEHPQQ
jgi:uncharacterized membrane protein YagU involved in acid resistance